MPQPKWAQTQKKGDLRSFEPLWVA